MAGKRKAMRAALLKRKTHPFTVDGIELFVIEPSMRLASSMGDKADDDSNSLLSPGIVAYILECIVDDEGVALFTSEEDLAELGAGRLGALITNSVKEWKGDDEGDDEGNDDAPSTAP